MTGEMRCRVCGLRQSESIWGADGQTPSLLACACCGCTFGRDDASSQAVRALRERWRASGGAWVEPLKRPASWRVDEQLAALPRFALRILPSLRGAGPAWVPFRFAGTDPFEGLVVEFVGIGGGEWVGNFQRGIGSVDAVLFAPQRTDQAVVLAGGMGYVVELDTHALVRSFGGAVNDLFYLPNREVIIFGNGLWFECEGPAGTVWRTQRVSWDGTRDVRLDGLFVHGSAFDVNDHAWHPFVLNIESGEIEGGAHPPP
jgi:hypothetical protein